MNINGIKNEIAQVLSRPVEIIETKQDIEVEQIPKKNKAYNLYCSVMFVDMRGSTVHTLENSKSNMAKVYKALARVVVSATAEHGGDVKQIVGDGFLCIFVNDNEGKSSQKAIDCATTINTYIELALNPEIKNISKPAEVGIGICTGHILLTKVGRKGKGKYNVPIFPGIVTNMASKFCGQAGGEEVIVDDITYSQLKASDKELFQQSSITVNGDKYTIYRSGELKWQN